MRSSRIVIPGGRPARDRHERPEARQQCGVFQPQAEGWPFGKVRLRLDGKVQSNREPDRSECDLEIGDELIAVLSLQHDASNGTAGWQQLADEVVDEAVGERDGRGGMCAGDVRKSGSALCVQQRVEISRTTAAYQTQRADLSAG